MNRKVLLICFIIFGLIIISFSLSLLWQFHGKHSFIVSKEVLNNPDYFHFLYFLREKRIRFVRLDKPGFDRFFMKWYPKLVIKRELQGKPYLGDHLIKSQNYYLGVDITSNLVRLDGTERKQILRKVKQRALKNISLLTEKQLQINKRLLVNKEDGKPVTFYLVDTFSLENFKSKPKHNLSYEPEVSKPLTVLGFAGDVAFEEHVKNIIHTKGPAAVFKQAIPLMENVDLFSINLEFTVSEIGNQEKKNYTFQANEYEFQAIVSSPIKYVTTANNHIKDFGEEALKDTMKYLTKYQIYYSGVGLNRQEAFQPALFNINNNFLAFFSICKVPQEYGGYDTMKNFTATDRQAGFANDDLTVIKPLFNQYKNGIIIIQPHTGMEYRLRPSLAHRNLAKSLIDAGAHAVICHHPHVINGVEIYKNRLIAYSLGDFVFDIQKQYADEGLILYLYIYQQEIKSWAFYPTVSHYGQVVLDENRLVEVEKRFLALSKELNP
ncbi:MAG: CapA family protein [Spirochaetes bacterium]|nr:CapA family protein [Spirochaetota bacterium]